jgi:hypothetical protein
MTPNSTNARRQIDNFVSRAAGNGARIRNLRAESFRNQVSVLILVHKNAISPTTPVGAPRRGHQRAPGSGQAGSSIPQKRNREPPIASSVGVNIRWREPPRTDTGWTTLRAFFRIRETSPNAQNGLWTAKATSARTAALGSRVMRRRGQLIGTGPR